MTKVAPLSGVNEAIERKMIGIIVREHSFEAIVDLPEANRLLGHIENFRFDKHREEFPTYRNAMLETVRWFLATRLERQIEKIKSTSNLAIDLTKLYRLQINCH